MPIDSTWYVVTRSILAHSFSASKGYYPSVERQGASMIRISHVRALEGKDKAPGRCLRCKTQFVPVTFAPRAL
jgi:hypothetical protein